MNIPEAGFVQVDRNIAVSSLNSTAQGTVIFGAEYNVMPIVIVNRQQICGTDVLQIINGNICSACIDIECTPVLCCGGNAAAGDI
ncbi:Uncharacterised protein [Klebsiella oxytoca]|nr:Uncharacterised protein [Klebsiella oxytoca]